MWYSRHTEGKDCVVWLCISSYTGNLWIMVLKQLLRRKWRQTCGRGEVWAGLCMRDVYLPIYCFCLCTSSVFPSNLKALPVGEITQIMHMQGLCRQSGKTALITLPGRFFCSTCGIACCSTSFPPNWERRTAGHSYRRCVLHVWKCSRL